MATITDRTVHIHHLAGEACIACGDADDGSRPFMTDPGLWNREARSCSPGSIVSPSYVLTTRAGFNARTSALKDERYPDFRKVPPGDR